MTESGHDALRRPSPRPHPVMPRAVTEDPAPESVAQQASLAFVESVLHQREQARLRYLGFRMLIMVCWTFTASLRLGAVLALSAVVFGLGGTALVALGYQSYVSRRTAARVARGECDPSWDANVPQQLLATVGAGAMQPYVKASKELAGTITLNRDGWTWTGRAPHGGESMYEMHFPLSSPVLLKQRWSAWSLGFLILQNDQGGTAGFSVTRVGNLRQTARALGATVM